MFQLIRHKAIIQYTFLSFFIMLNRNFYPALELYPEILLVHHDYHIHKPKPEIFGEFSEQIFKSAYFINEPSDHQRPAPSLCQLVLKLFLLSQYLPVLLLQMPLPPSVPIETPGAEGAWNVAELSTSGCSPSSDTWKIFHFR